MQEETKLNELKKGDSAKLGRFSLYFKDYPFKCLEVCPTSKNPRGLFNFHCFKGDNRWLAGMTKTSYYQSNVYETSLRDDSTVWDTLKFVDEALQELRNALNDIYKEKLCKNKK